MSPLIVFRVSPALPIPTAANSLPSPIEHVPFKVVLTGSKRVGFALLSARKWSSLIPLPVKPAGKMPSPIFHIYSDGGFAIPKHTRRHAEAAFNDAASTLARHFAGGNNITGDVKPLPVRYTPAQRAAIAKAAAVAVPQRPAPVMAAVPPPARGVSKRARSRLPVKVTAKATAKATVTATVMATVKAPAKAPARAPAKAPAKVPAKASAKARVEAKPKSILKPARNSDAEYVQYCSEGPPAKRGGLQQPTGTIADTTMSRFPTGEWDLDNLPSNQPDRYAETVSCEQEIKATLDLGARPTKVIFHEHLVSDSWTARGRAVIRNYAVVHYRLKSKA